MSKSQSDPVLIIGAGISGLTLAQACRKADIPYLIFERDDSASYRNSGWGLTIHWALSDFKAILPDELVARFPETYVNRKAVEAGERGSFTFFDLATAEARLTLPASEGIRMSREKLKILLLTDLDVQWSKTLVNVEPFDEGVRASFSDGTAATGGLVVGCDGAHSTVRRLLHPEEHQNSQLLVRVLSVTAQFTESQISTIRDLDPFSLQGTDSQTDTYLSFSLLENPPHSQPDNPYKCQIILSWPYREDWLDRADPIGVPNTKTGQLTLMKHLSQSWAEPFRSLVQNIPRDADIRPIELADWEPRTSSGFGGRVTLVGDAAHAMVMYRGEGFDHSLVDVASLLEGIRVLYAEGSGEGDFEAGRAAYEGEMVERTGLAVGAERRACLDAHGFARVGEGSSLVKRADLDEG